jgi:hypothetical protein
MICADPLTRPEFARTGNCLVFAPSGSVNKWEANIYFKSLYACNRIYGIFAGSHIVSAWRECLAHRLPEFPLWLAAHSLDRYSLVDERTIP